MTLSEFNALAVERAREELLRCCGCGRWADAVLSARPFRDKADLLAVSDAAWAATGEDEWREAAERPRPEGT